MLRLAPRCSISATEIVAGKQRFPPFRKCFRNGQHRSFQFKGERYAPDLAVVFKAHRLWKASAWFYQVPEDGHALDAIVSETLGVKVVAEGQKIRMFDRAGNEILSLREMLERERRKREELERRFSELEQKLKSGSL